ncbi:MAG TPA: hypothetical protein VLA94_02060 [Syntrophales bacterium]|nr:hypothetical protein [Syntrophales bacterium]
MRYPAGPAAGKNETYLGAAGYTGKLGLFFLSTAWARQGGMKSRKKTATVTNIAKRCQRFEFMSDSLGSKLKGRL